MPYLSGLGFGFALLLLSVCNGRDASRCEDADLLDTFFGTSTLGFVRAKILKTRDRRSAAGFRVIDVMVLQNFKGCKGRARRTILILDACDISIIKGEEYVFPIRSGIVPKVFPGDVS